MHVELQVVTPTELLPGDTPPREAFDHVWRHVRLRADESAGARPASWLWVGR